EIESVRRRIDQDVRISVRSLEELADKSRHRLLLALGCLAMVMTGSVVVTDTVFDTHRLPHFASGVHGLPARLVSQPLVIPVAKRDDRAWRNHHDELVMVVRQTIRVQLLHALLEPGVVGVIDLLDVGARAVSEGLRGSPSVNPTTA